MAKFTKGPWRISEIKASPFTDYVVSAKTQKSHNEEIARVWFLGNDEAEYNARLIAAAPDMYELLMEARNYFLPNLSIEPEIRALLARIDGE